MYIGELTTEKTQEPLYRYLES